MFQQPNGVLADLNASINAYRSQQQDIWQLLVPKPEYISAIQDN